MANDVADVTDEAEGGAEFILSSQPIVPLEQRATGALSDYENLGELPRSYGGAFLFAIARDPHTLFVYWDIDWATTFGDTPPADRKVHLRVLWHEGIEESTAAVEPLAGSHLLPALHARSSYRVEIGYYSPENVWNSVAISAAVITPPDDVAENGPVDVATIPFHLSFQRIVDTFRGSKYDGDALAEIVGRLAASRRQLGRDPAGKRTRIVARPRVGPVRDERISTRPAAERTGSVRQPRTRGIDPRLRRNEPDVATAAVALVPVCLG